MAPTPQVLVWPGEFVFGYPGDDAGSVCPWASHIRKANPRNDIHYAEFGRTQTHRLLRRGIPYGPESSSTDREASEIKPSEINRPPLPPRSIT